MASVSMTVNGKAVTGDVEPRTLIVQFLRETLRLTGTHVGCDTSQCGACVIHLDGIAAKSCTVLALQCEGSQVLTIEGLDTPQKLSPEQEAFIETGAFQCGYCTSGLILMAGQLLDEHPARMRKCANPDCPFWFLDTTRSGTRRWCSMTVCGNRLKARRHYRRQHHG